MKACRVCGCTEQAACIEFGPDGYGWPCHWGNGTDTCSACLPAFEPPAFGLMTEDEEPVAIAPALRGMVARPRVQTSGTRSSAEQLAGLVLRHERDLVSVEGEPAWVEVTPRRWKNMVKLARQVKR